MHKNDKDKILITITRNSQREDYINIYNIMHKACLRFSAAVLETAPIRKWRWSSTNKSLANHNFKDICIVNHKVLYCKFS